MTAPAVPGVFTADSSGSGQAAALNQDGSYNDAGHPAPAGSFVTLFVTGEGQTVPAGIDGKPASTPLPKPVLPVTVTIGGENATVPYAGGAPGEVAGLMQLNVQIPADAMPGSSIGIQVKIGDAPSQDAVTIAVSSN
jgi:uncharacterized protein (TIGR03437 family)